MGTPQLPPEEAAGVCVQGLWEGQLFPPREREARGPGLGTSVSRRGLVCWGSSRDSLGVSELVSSMAPKKLSPLPSPTYVRRVGVQGH